MQGRHPWSLFSLSLTITLLLVSCSSGGVSSTHSSAPSATPATPPVTTMPRSTTVTYQPSSLPPSATATTTPSASDSHGYGQEQSGATPQRPTVTPTATPTPRSPTPEATLSVPTTIQIAIYDFGFNPATVVVPPGTTIVWVNTGAVQHTVADKQLSWSSGLLAPGDRYQHTFTQPGQYPYWCTLHPDMLGMVIVR